MFAGTWCMKDSDTTLSATTTFVASSSRADRGSRLSYTPFDATSHYSASSYWKITGANIIVPYVNWGPDTSKMPCTYTVTATTFSVNCRGTTYSGDKGICTSTPSPTVDPQSANIAEANNFGGSFCIVESQASVTTSQQTSLVESYAVDSTYSNIGARVWWLPKNKNGDKSASTYFRIEDAVNMSPKFADMYTNWRQTFRCVYSLVPGASFEIACNTNRPSSTTDRTGYHYSGSIGACVGDTPSPTTPAPTMLPADAVPDGGLFSTLCWTGTNLNMVATQITPDALTAATSLSSDPVYGVRVFAGSSGTSYSTPEYWKIFGTGANGMKQATMYKDWDPYRNCIYSVSGTTFTMACSLTISSPAPTTLAPSMTSVVYTGTSCASITPAPTADPAAAINGAITDSATFAATEWCETDSSGAQRTKTVRASTSYASTWGVRVFEGAVEGKSQYSAQNYWKLTDGASNVKTLNVHTAWNSNIQYCVYSLTPATYSVYCLPGAQPASLPSSGYTYSGIAGACAAGKSSQPTGSFSGTWCEVTSGSSSSSRTVTLETANTRSDLGTRVFATQDRRASNPGDYSAPTYFKLGLTPSQTTYHEKWDLKYLCTYSASASSYRFDCAVGAAPAPNSGTFVVQGTLGTC